MKVKVYNLEGKETGEMTLQDSVFNVPIKQEVVHEVFNAQLARQREPWADTKTRGEVRGGGKKPWQQKGTGRARHGSIRSPIWKGGGVSFGPVSTRNYKIKINKETRRVAIRMCLTDRVANNFLLVVDNFDFKAPKTKIFVDFLKSLPVKSKSFLVLNDGNDKVVRMTNNLKKVSTVPATDVNVMEILSKGAIITSKAGIEKIEKILSK